MNRRPPSIPSLALALLPLLAGPLAAQLVFEAPVRYPVSGGSGAPFAAGDLDDDGDVDVVVRGATGFEVLLNDGGGTFAAPLAVPAAGGLIRLAHLDADAFPDLVVANGGVDVRLGLGDGTFAPATTIFTPTDQLVTSLTVADVTGDGHLDVVAHNGAVGQNADERADVVPGHGDGTFGAASLLGQFPDTVPHQSLVGDIDGDLVDDIVVVTGAIASSSAWVFLGTGGGAFTGAGFFAVGTSSAGRAALVDVDGDAVLDLVLTDVIGLGVKRGLGNGAFGPASIQVPGFMVGGVIMADLDLDGHLDVACRDFLRRELVFARGATDGTFTTNLRVTGVEGGSFLDGAPGGADFDGDGFVDVAMTEGGNVPVDFLVFRNHTYAPGDAFVDLGFVLADDSQFHEAAPIFLADGTLVGGETVTLRVQPQGVSSQLAWFVKGLAPVFAPFKGGTMVPDVQFLTGPLPVPPSGLQFSGPMPLGVPPGTQFWMQFWFQPGGPGLPFSATSAIEATAP